MSSEKCKKCRAEIGHSQSRVGRPKRYCSPSCRRAAEFELRRLNDHLTALEGLLMHVRQAIARRDPMGFDGWGKPALAEVRIAEEIARLEARLKELCS